MLWLGVTCCGVVPWAQTSNWNPKKTMEKKFQPIFTKNMVCTCTDCNQWLCSSEQGIHWNLPPEAAVLTTCKPLEGLLKLYQLFQKILRISSWMKIWKNKKDTNLLSLNTLFNCWSTGGSKRWTCNLFFRASLHSIVQLNRWVHLCHLLFTAQDEVTAAFAVIFIQRKQENTRQSK